MASPRIRNLRRRARLKLNYLLLKQKSKCYYCRRQIARPYQLRGKILVQTEDEIIYMDSDGELQTIGVATTDHVQPLGEGGTSRFRNLVAACWNCNMDRNEEARKR
jgi:5-methylcytosine-specific restriction endonuclease McrA